MATEKITLSGLYNFDNQLFSKLTLPEGIDRDLFIATLMLNAGEFEVLYSKPEFMKNSIGVWSMKWYRTFSEWLRGTEETFNPIYNYDRFEESEDHGGRSYESKTTADYSDNRTQNLEDKRTANLEDKRTANLEDKRTADLKEELTHDTENETTFDNKDTTSQTTDATTLHDVSAYDQSTGYVPSSKDTINNGVSEVEHSGTVTVDNTGSDTTETTGTDTMAHTGTDTMAHTGTDTTEHTGTDNIRHAGTLSDIGGKETNNAKHTAHMYGNISVTTSAAMLKEFYDISKWNLYNHMSDVFTSELLIAVY